MNPERYRVYFEDECPSIGAGWRPVVARIGYKWVHIKTPGAERGTKIKRLVWDKLRKERHENQAVPKSDSQGLTDPEIPIQSGYGS